MAAYARGDYRDAAELLSAALEAAPSPGVSFYLGIARLEAGPAESALDAFRAALDPPKNPYAADAHFYLAKAWLRLGEADSALAHLNAVPPSAARLHDQASALADNVREVIR
ncbi:MAG: tetratricopeptide repeat protein [Gemmatimonadota bacterium]|nr:MAG: tetratricopeptide repeat protein [Gemmatimonadota bacterium]